MKKETNCGIIKEPRTGCKDIFNAYMCKNAIFGRNDIPQCPTTATKLPEEVITWEEAKSFYKKELRLKNETFKMLLHMVHLPRSRSRIMEPK